MIGYAGAENENAMEIDYFPCAVLIGLRHGIETPTSWRNVHRTATLRHGVRSAHIFFVGGCAVAQHVHRTGPYCNHLLVEFPVQFGVALIKVEVRVAEKGRSIVELLVDGGNAGAYERRESVGI